MHITESTPNKKVSVWFRESETPYIVSEENTSYLYRVMNIERREETRLEVSEGVYAILNTFSPQIFSVSDMSTKGMSYIYFKSEEEIPEPLTLDILVIGSGFCLEKIPFRKVADYKAYDDKGSGRFEKRVACIQFVDLTDDQKEKIDAFIAKYIEKTIN